MRNNGADDIEEDMLQEVYEKATEVSLSLFISFSSEQLVGFHPYHCFSFNHILTKKSVVITELNEEILPRVINVDFRNIHSEANYVS